MRSSGSTRRRPERGIRIGVVLVGDDDPRRCTGRRLIRLGLADEVRNAPGPNDRSVVLDPYARVPLTRADRSRAAAGGLVAVDCSWNRLSAARSERPGPARPPTGSAARRLPILVAANPQHFGRLGELNTVEALAAALYLLGGSDEAARLLSGFAGGDAFLQLNRARLDRYARARSAEELVESEHVLFGGP